MKAVPVFLFMKGTKKKKPSPSPRTSAFLEMACRKASRDYLCLAEACLSPVFDTGKNRLHLF